MFARQSAASCGRVISERMSLNARTAGIAVQSFTRRMAGPRSSPSQSLRYASTTPTPTPGSRTGPSSSRAPPAAYTILGALAFTISTYGSYQYVSYKRAVEESKKMEVPLDVSDRYNKNARTFDDEVAWTEWATGINGDRKKLLSMCKGNILEVACGTGRNLPYFPLGETRSVTKDGRGYTKGCRTITFVDQSPEMIEVAREKFEKQHAEWMPRTRWFAQSAMEHIPLPTELFKFQFNKPVNGTTECPPRKFDTVIETMGLCSVPDPAAYLRRLGELIEPTGQILLLEHGRSDRKWVNKILDDLAPAHANKHGCWWNRDIEAIVRESGLTVVKSHRHHFGTTMWYILRPAGANANAEEEERK